MTNQPTILIVDDEHRICRSLEILLQEEGSYRTKTANDYYQALERLKEPVDLVLTDLTMPGKTGLELLSDIKKEKPSMPVILMTAYSTVESAVSAMKEGANDYISKPFDNDDLLRLIRKVLHQAGTLPHEDPPLRGRYGDIIGQSQKIQEVYRWIARAAETDSTVLITGESGTGKELIARAIHFSGSRKSKAFVAINCAALPENLLESELFGHEKGAFTGAIREKEGKFELANRGTLFLDEIGEMPLSLQAKILRVLQEREFERVGGQTPIHVDVRILAATNKNLQKEVAEGKFREDLFYRLNVLTIEAPPLRERRDDLPLLIDHFLEEKCRRLGVARKTLSREAMDWLVSNDYPGNIRELENILERATVISGGTQIELADLSSTPATVHSAMISGSIPIEGGMGMIERLTADLERDLIERALLTFPDRSNTELADLMGTSRRILESRMRLYGMKKPSGKTTT